MHPIGEKETEALLSIRSSMLVACDFLSEFVSMLCSCCVKPDASHWKMKNQGLFLEFGIQC